MSHVGTIPELKERLQAGYVLELVLSSPSQPPPLAWIYAHWPSAQIVEQFEGYVQLRLPKANVPSLAQAFNILETGMQKEYSSRHKIYEYEYTSIQLHLQVYLLVHA